jgi:hypothetical protein
LKTSLAALCFLSIMFGTGNAQLVVTSAENDDLIRVSRTGSMNITQDLMVKGLENTSSTKAVKLSPNKTIAFRAKHRNDKGVITQSVIRLGLEGYYIPLKALLK